MTREQFMNMEDFFLLADPRIMIEWSEIVRNKGNYLVNVRDKGSYLVNVRDKGNYLVNVRDKGNYLVKVIALSLIFPRHIQW